MFLILAVWAGILFIHDKKYSVKFKGVEISAEG